MGLQPLKVVMRQQPQAEPVNYFWCGMFLIHDRISFVPADSLFLVYCPLIHFGEPVSVSARRCSSRLMPCRRIVVAPLLSTGARGPGSGRSRWLTLSAPVPPPLLRGPGHPNRCAETPT